MFNTFDNFNFYLDRKKPYQSYGRNQSENEALFLDLKIYKILVDNKIPCNIVEGNIQGYNKIVQEVIINHEQKKNT